MIDQIGRFLNNCCWLVELKLIRQNIDGEECRDEDEQVVRILLLGLRFKNGKVAF